MEVWSRAPTSWSRRLPTILSFTIGWGRNIFLPLKPLRLVNKSRTLAWKAAVLTTTLGLLPVTLQQLSFTTLTGFCIKRYLLFRYETTPMCETQCGLSTLPANTRHWPNAGPIIDGPPSATLAQHQVSTGSTPRVCWAAFNSMLVC